MLIRDHIEQAIQVFVEAEDPEERSLAFEELAEARGAGALLARRVRKMPARLHPILVALAERIAGIEGLQLLEALLQAGDEATEEAALLAIGTLGEAAGMLTLLNWLASSASLEQRPTLFLSLLELSSLDQAGFGATLPQLDSAILGEVARILSQQDQGLAPELLELGRSAQRELRKRRLRTFGAILERSRDPSQRGFGREHIVAELLHLLLEQRSSLLLLGPSGVGKTLLLREALHQLESQGQATMALESSTGLLMAGTRFLGEWQTRLRDLIQVAKGDLDLVVYLSDINNLLGAGTTQKSEESMADLLAPHLANGSLRLIGECTAEELRRGLDQRPAFRRLFKLVNIPEPLAGESKKILDEAAQHMARHYSQRLQLNLHYGEAFLSRLAEVADHMRPGVARPGRAIELLRTTFEHLSPSDGEDEDELVLDTHHLIETAARESGVRSAILDDRRRLDLPQLERFFSTRVIGQSLAVSAIVDLVTLVKAGLCDPSQPLSVLFFVGPTGVGKTELAKTLAEFLFGSAERMIRLDMSEYGDAHAVERLVGSSLAPEFSLNRLGGLTSRIRQQPLSVILLDEIEKAHPSVFDLMLQVMDDGRLTDASGKVINFTQAIIIMTSNIGGEETLQRGIGFAPIAQRPLDDEAYRRELEHSFRPEFINRIDRVVPFFALDEEAMREIAQREIHKALRRSGITRRQLGVDIQPSLLELITREGFDPRYGARPLKRAIEGRVLLPIARAIVSHGARAHQTLLHLRARDDETLAIFDEKLDAAPREEQPPAQEESNAAEDIALAMAEMHTLERFAQHQGLNKRKSRLIKASGQPAFWDKPALARQTLSEIHWIERANNALQRLARKARALHYLDRQQERVAANSALAHDLALSLMPEIRTLRAAISYREAPLRDEAYLLIERLDSHEFAPDPCQLLAQAYLNFAKRRRFRALIIDQSSDEGAQESLRRVVLYFEGLSLFGLLSGESGTHKFLSRSRLPQQSATKRVAFVKVSPLPSPDLDAAKTQVHRPSLTPLQSSNLLGKIRSLLKAESRCGRVRAELHSPLTEDEALNHAVTLVAAMLRRDKFEKSGKTVRTYALGEHPRVKDHRGKTRPESLDEVLNGQLENFIYEHALAQAKRNP